MRSFILFTLFLLMPFAAYADNPVPEPDSSRTADSSNVAENSQVEDTTHVIEVDTLIYHPTLDTAFGVQVTNTTNYEEHLTQNPTVALFKSMFVPGWGQVGNHRYIKAGVIAAAETYFTIRAVDHGRKASDFRSQWNASDDPDLRDIYYGKYMRERDKRNKFIWFAGITVFVSMFDAYVDAHLSGAPDNERNNKVDLRVGPDADGGAQAALSYSF